VGERGKASSNNPTEIRRPSRLVRHAVSGGVKRLTVQIIATGHCPLGSPRRSSARRPRRRSGVESPGLFLSAEPATRQTPQKGSVLGLTVGAHPPAHSQSDGGRSPGQLPPSFPQGSFLFRAAHHRPYELVGVAVCGHDMRPKVLPHSSSTALNPALPPAQPFD
jgi:hypothetical protein